MIKVVEWLAVTYLAIIVVTSLFLLGACLKERYFKSRLSSPFDKVLTKSVFIQVDGKSVICNFVSWDGGINWHEYRQEGRAVKVRFPKRELWRMFDDIFLQELAAKAPPPPPGARREPKW